VLLGNFSAFSDFATEAVTFVEFPETLISNTVEHLDKH